MNKGFELEWNKFIKEYGKSFGSLFNGLKRRKMIAESFYAQGHLDALKEENDRLGKLSNRMKLLNGGTKMEEMNSEPKRFNKKKIVPLVILSLVAIGLVSAALVSYLSNKVSGTVGVSSPMSVEITETTKGTIVGDTFSVDLKGGEFFVVSTTTRNLADVPITAVLVEVKVPNFDGIGITYYHDDGTWEGNIPVCVVNNTAYYYVGPAGGFNAEVGYNMTATSTITTAQDLAPGTYNTKIKVIPAVNRVC